MPQDVQVLFQVYMPTYDLVGLSSLFHTSPLGHNSNTKTHSRGIHTESFRPDLGGVALLLRLYGESTEHSKMIPGRKSVRPVCSGRHSHTGENPEGAKIQCNSFGLRFLSY